MIDFETLFPLHLNESVRLELVEKEETGWLVRTITFDGDALRDVHEQVVGFQLFEADSTESLQQRVIANFEATLSKLPVELFS